jgi:putative ABC transport system permease protein
MRILWQDIRYGLRMAARNPGFSAVVVLILAVGIGATTTMLNVVDAVMLRPCPYKDPDTLVWVCETNPNGTQANMASIPNFCDWREQNHVFESLAAANRRGCIVSHGDRNEKCNAMFVSDGFFSTLGVKPILGRAFLPEEKETGGQRAVILSYDYWQRWFAGDPSAIGKMLIVDEQAYSIVGILPRSFRWVFRREACQLWVPMHPETVGEDHRSWRGTDVVGRLKNGIGVMQAQAEMNIIAKRLARAHPDKLTGVGALVVPMNKAYRTMIGWSGNPYTIVILLSIVSDVLLIACIHVATLLVARSVAREREIAIREALGANRSRVVRQLLTENVLLCALSGLLGLVLAHWGVSIVSALRGGTVKLIPWFIDLNMNGRSILYVLSVSLLTCVFFGVLPAFWTSRINLGRSLSAGRTPDRGPRFQRMRASLVIADIAVAFVILVAAGLLINTYVHILNFDTRLNSKNVLSMTIKLNEDAPPYSEANRRSRLFEGVLERISSLPGVRCAALANATPSWPGYNGGYFAPEGFPPGQDRMMIRCTTITRAYFRVFEIPLLRGRYFTEHETSASSPVAIINGAMAQRLWPDQNPLGKYIVQRVYFVRRGSKESKLIVREIIGVVGNVKHFLRYFASDDSVKSFTSFPDDVVYIPGYKDTLMIRTEGYPKRLLTAVRKEVRAIDKNVVLCDVATAEEEIATLFSPQRFNMLFLSAFAIVALTLTGVGIYGTIAYIVSRRTHEIGIRIALGALSGDVLRSILRQGLKLTVIGLIIGTAGAFAATRIIRSLLHDVSPTDPLTFVCISFLLVGVAVLATYIPARRAAKIDPMEALHYE